MEFKTEISGIHTRITGNTYQTTDYDQFKRLEGNREIRSIRVNKIKKSIETAGYIYNPIVVNEKFEVIDGQGRLEVLKLLGMPVDFVVAKGAGIKECIALNASSTVWCMKDYIESFCELGYEDYITLNELLQEYPELKFNTVVCIASGIASLPTKSIKEGKLHVPKDELQQIRCDLDVAKRAGAIFAQVDGPKDYYIYAAVFAVRNGADFDRIISTVSRTKLNPAPNIKTALLELSDVYNKGLKTLEKRIYLYTDYQKMNIEKHSWYQAKYMKTA